MGETGSYIAVRQEPFLFWFKNAVQTVITIFIEQVLIYKSYENEDNLFCDPFYVVLLHMLACMC